VLNIFPGGDDQLDLYEDDGESQAYEQDAFTRWPITLHDLRTALTLTLAPLVGDYAGRPKRRNVWVVVNFIDEPQSIEVAGIGAEAVTRAYDPQTRRLTITLADLDPRRHHELRIAL
jgi:hypothetical protein